MLHLYVGVCHPCCLVLTFAAVHIHTMYILSGWSDAVVHSPVCACFHVHNVPVSSGTVPRAEPVTYVISYKVRQSSTAAGDVMGDVRVA